MSIPTPPKRSGLNRILSLATAFLVATFGLIAVPTTAGAADAPTLTVTEAPRAGGPVTISGSGFDATLPDGVYVGIGSSGATNFYTAGIATESTIWVSPGNPDAGALAHMEADGSFTITLNAPAYSDGASYTVYASKAHGAGMGDPSQNATAPVAYEPAAPVTAPTQTALSVSATEVAEGDTVTLTATVTPAEAVGSVQFSSNGAPLAGGNIALEGGTAVFDAILPAGPNSITASFIPGDSGFAASTSAARSVNVTAPNQPATPRVTVTPAGPLDPAVDNVLTVSGTGFEGPGAADGTYVLVGETSVWQGEGALPRDGWIALDWVRAPQIVDGAFSMTITVPAGKLDPAKSYQVATSSSGRLSATDRSLDTFTPIEVQQPAAGGPRVTATPSQNLDPNVENVITVSGTGFEGPGASMGAYVLIGETSIWSGGGPLVSSGWLAQAWVRATDIVDGAFTVNITVPAGSFDPAKQYQVATSAAHMLSATDRSLDTFTPLAVADIAAEPGVRLSASTVKQGGQITFTGVGFAEGDTVTAVVNSEPVQLGNKTANAQGVVTYDWVVPTDFEAGPHTVTMRSGTTVVSAPFTVEALVIVSDGGPGEQVGQCVARAVTGGNFSWGINGSFKNYITGPIAKGSFSGGNFVASGGAFNVNDGGVGRANFSGSIVATGHGGLLNMQLSNPSIQITGPGTAILFAYVSSTDATGAPSMSGTVAFANLHFSGPTISAGSLTVNASATLTAAGSKAFADFYPAGTALDPVSFSVSLGGDVACDSSTDPVKLASTGAPTDAGLAPLSIAALVMLLGFGLIRTRTRARRQHA